MYSCRTHAHDIVTKYLASNEDACTLVGKVGTALWPQNTPREHVVFLHGQYRVIIAALSVFGRLVQLNYLSN